jgi:predicted transcriptional regulator
LPTINQTPCTIREVAYRPLDLPCDRCGCPAQGYRTAERIAVDLDLDHPILLSVTVSVHHCQACAHYFRAQPPFLRKDATYTRRVFQKAVAAVYRDGMAMRRVPERLAGDFWVQPSEGMIRQWCADYRAGFDFKADYQPWVVREFSGILCVDEVYQDKLARLLAVDPAAPDGDRLVGYQLVHGSVDADVTAAFLTHLKEAGIQPEEVITDGSSLYPAVLAKVWPAAAHQLCLFHETRRVTKAAMEVIQAARSALPSPAPEPGSGFRGRLYDQPPSENPADPAHQRWQMRRKVREAGIAHVHTLAEQGLSQRAIARQLGLHRKTVKQWLQMEPPAEIAENFVQVWHDRTIPKADALRRAARQTKHQRVHELRSQGLSYSAIAREVGLHRVSVKQWLLQSPPPDARPEGVATCHVPPDAALGEQDGSGAAPVSAPVGSSSLSGGPTPPPAPWRDWDQVRQVREALREQRFLLLRRPEHLDSDQQAQVAALLASPLAELTTAHTFVRAWYALCKDEQGQRRTVAEARARYEAWRSNPTYLALPALRRALARMSDAHFERLSAFLQQPHWEATNNGAERGARAFRHRQAPHFNLRSQESIAGDLMVSRYLRKAAMTSNEHQRASRSGRGREPTLLAESRP